MLAVLGLNDNRATVIRRMWNDIALHTVHASPGGVVSPDEERRFWLRYYYGTFALGKHGEPAYFKWADPSPQGTPPRFIGFGGWSLTVDWIIYGICL